MGSVLLIKTPNGLQPANDEQFELMKRVGLGNVIEVSWKEVRNYEYHKKFFAMLNIGFDAFEPPETQFKGKPVMKNFDRFRKDCIIQAGYYDVVANLNGEVRAEAHSIKFGRMKQEDFEKLYNAVANVLLIKVLRNYTRPDLDNVVQQLIRF